MNNLFTSFRTVLKAERANWCLLLSINCGLFVFLNYFARLHDCPLTNFTDRSIGIAVLSGVDVSARTWVYIRSILAGISVFLGAYLCCLWVNAFMQRAIRSLYITIEQQVLLILGVFSVWLTLRAVIADEQFQDYFLEPLLILFACIGVTFFLIFLKILSFHRKRVYLTYASNYSFIMVVLSGAYAAFFVGWVVFDGAFTFTVRHFAGYFLIVLIGILSYPMLLPKFFTRWQNMNYAFIAAGIPLAAIPVSLPLANELQFTLSGRWDISPRLVSALIIGLLFVISISMFILLIHRPKAGRKTADLIRNWYFPLFLATVFSFNAYRHTITFERFDLFHQGEVSVPTHQLFSFNSLPFIHIFPTHALSDMLTQTLYSWLNGYRGVEMFLWDWLNTLIGLLFLYGVLARLTSPLFGLCLIIFTPTELLFPAYLRIALTLLPVLLVPWVAKRPGVFRYSVLWLSVVWVGLWRYDFGVAAMASMLFLLPGFCTFSSRHRPPCSWLASCATPLLSLLGVCGAALLAYGVVIFFNGQSIRELLTQFWYYLKVQAPTQSYTTIFAEFTSAAVWRYFLVPLISMAYIAVFVIDLVLKRHIGGYARLILAYLAVYSLIMSVRALHRHSLMERGFPTLVIFLLCMSVHYFTNIKKSSASIIILSVLFFSFLIFSFDRNGYIPLIHQKRLFKELQGVPNFNYSRINPKGLFTFDYWYKQPPRVTITNETQYANLVDFCNTIMREDQTFFDFANAPMLYVFANRKFPAYVIPNLLHVSEPIQQYLVQRLDAIFQQGQLPFVIFKQGNWWDAVDGVPNEMRSYRIAEFIYHHYQPFVMVDNYEIWKARDLTLANMPTFKPLAFQARERFQAFDLTARTDADGHIVMQSGSVDPQVSNLIEMGSGLHLHGGKQYALKITYTSSIAGMLELFYAFEGHSFYEQASMRIAVVATDAETEGVILIPKSDRPIWLRNIRFDPPSDAVFTIHRVEGIGVEKYVTPIINTTPQQFNLTKLPYLWGTYDEYHAAHATPVLQTLTLPTTLVEPNQPMEIPCDAEIDKTSGNYLHFTIRSDREGTVTLRYGKQNAAQIQFDVVASKKEEDYLIRISTQWAWMSEPIDAITVEASTLIHISQVLIRKGD